MRFLNQNNNSMDNIQKHFSAAALCAAFLFFAAFASFGQNVIYQCDFEDATENAEWTLANGSQTNQWYIGTAANNGGSNGLYISNDGGASNAYDNTSTSYVYAYREINVTETAWYNLELDWRLNGQYYYDIMNMFLIPTSVNPDLSAGNPNGMEYSPYSTPSGWIGATGVLYGYSEWTHVFIEQEIEAGTYYLVLFWKNNNSYGENPAAAIDNISIAKNNCVSISNVWVEDVEAESATIVWEERGTATSWDIVISLDYLEDADLESADFITVTDMTYSLTGLEPLTYYYIYVRAACSNNEHSLWKSTSFETPRIPATLPYSFGFEDDTENANWELSDEADNLWAIGTAVSNGGEKGLYISENRGISNTYNNSKQSYAYAFRTINITEPDEYQFDFDWRANGGDSGYDLLRAFVIPTSLDPSISYGYHNDMYSNYNDAPSGWIDASADGLMSGQPRWQHSSKVLDLDAGTYYFVFFWKNSDGGDGNNPPAAIDNISIQRVINPAVTTSSVSGLNSTSATLHGNILSQGTSDITARGFEYGTDSENLSENTQSTDDTDEFSSTITGLAPNTTYYYRAYATNSEGTGYGTIKSFTTNGSYSGFDFVDLGLPSKTYWATMNIGATSTEDMGDYFAWGETTPKDTYEWSTYQYCNGSDESMTKYCNNPDFGDNGFTDNLATLEASDDAATANWGSGWRMPIADEAEELYTYCSHVWTTQNGVTGRLFTGPNGRSIFLPGIYNGMSNHYWTNSLYSSYPSEATTLLFGSGTRAELGDYYRYDGLPVRAVYRVAPYLATVSQSNVTLSSATLSGLSYDNGNSDVIERGFQYGTNPDNLTETIQSELGANEFTATLIGLAPNTTYYYRAYATNSDDTGYGEIKSFRTPSGQLGDHYYVNLGLPSGTMWATCNVGGTNFEDLGNEYAWGETTTKDEYTQNNYTYSDNPATLPADADAAAVNWNEDWVMPTQADMQELIDYCDTTWTIINGIVGLLFTSGNGNSIFIPTEYDGYTLYAYYWTSSLNTDNPTSAVYMNLYPGDYESDPGLGIGNIDRSYHAHVRPVYKVAPTAFELGDEPYNCDFENADENAQWVLANGRQPSKWYIGTAASNGGANGLYISADDGAHNSYNFAEPSSTYAYRLINITTADLYQFDFDWRAAGNEDYDYLRAFLIPASIDPDLTPGASYDPDWLNICSTEIMSEQPEWQHSRTAVNIEETGMYYLAFFWENDDYYYGNNPSAAIDNISICKATNFFIDNRDGNIYSFVTIGDQTWLAENLRYAGNIQLGTEISETVPYLYYPDGNEYNVSTYGYLYNWPAAMNGEESSYEIPSGVQGICPEGWHLPSEQEWVQLDDYLGRNNTGSMLAGYADSWFYGSLKQSEYFGATGFNALPAGVYSGTSIEFGHITRFWTTTTSVNNSDLIYHKDIISTYTTLYSDLNSKDFGNSVRCVRNIGSITATLPYDCDFEDDNENANWVLANGDETNKWYIGSATNNGGNNGLYISNDGGTTNAYTSTSESVVYAYRSIDIDENAFYEISFDWRSFGDVDNFDGILGVFMAPVSSDFDLSGGNNLTVLPDGWIVIAEEPLAGAPFWLNFSNTIYIDEGNYNLIFYWANEDNGGDFNPPAAIDNVSVTKVANPIVATSSVSDISATSATLHGSILSHGTSDIMVRGFEYGTDEGNLTEIVQSTDETNDFSVSLTNLASSTTYYYRAYATNSNGTGYGEIVAFNTKCSDEDMCEISYSLADSYGDGWTGNAINVVDAGTGTIIESLTFDYGSVATGTVEICNGREIIFEWVEGSYPEETIYQIFDVNGDEIFSGAGTISSPVSYTMSCSSCRIVADFAVTDITTESATISFTEQGQATSWELIFSETELDNNTLESYNNIITLTEPSYFATGLTIGTQYYVYVRSVCSDDDKGRWEKRTFNTTFCAPEDMCEISYELSDPENYGHGWFGAAIEVVDVETNIILATWKLENGETSKTGTLSVCNNRDIYFNWIAGAYDEDLTAYEVFDANEDEIFSGSGALSSPVSYTMSCPSCRIVADFTIADITNESATISWTERGTAESWELIISETELDDDALEVSAPTAILTNPYYSATGLTSITQYYVYVRSVCSDDDKSRWKKRAFVTTVCAPEYMCGISYELASEFGDGWNGGAINIVDVESEFVIATLTFDQGYSSTGIVDVCDGKEIRIDYTAGQFPDDASYHIFDANGDVIDSYFGLDSPTSHSQLYTVSCPTCRPVKNIRATEITTESATIRWADYGSAESWEIIVSDEEIDDNALDGNGAIVQSADSSFVATGLTPSTNYYVYVHALCLGNDESQWRSYSFTTTQIPASIPYTCDFEDADENANWVLANGNQTNQWHIGSAASNGGDNGLFISNDGGTSNEYDFNSGSVVYAYRTIDIDEDGIYEISFDWRSYPDVQEYSALLDVFLAPVSSDFDLSGGNNLNNLPSGWIMITEEPLSDVTSWQNFTKIINIDEGSYNLIFYWVNYDGDGENPPAAIDNISINSLTLDISVDYPMDRSTTSADIKIHYTNLTLTENSLFFYYGTNRNNINYRVVPHYNSTNEYFYAEITNLEPDTKYYYYAEEISEFGTLLSDTLSFYTYGSFIDDRDNHQYSTIRIGNQIWMAEDLDYAGDIPQGTIGETSSTEPYRYPTEYCTEYSTKLYNWPAAMNLAGSSNENPSGVQGVCPNGWHLPSEAEWQELYDTLGGSERDAGAQLVSGLYSDGKTIAESRYFCASGFNAIYSNGYDISYENATFWSATASNTDEAYYHRIYSGSTDLLSGSSEKGYGFNVRCVKGTTFYVYDTLPYCGESYTFGTQIITESGDYTRIVNLGEDTDSIYKLHITFVEIPVATISDFSNGCFGQNNGYATVSVEGGTAPYSYAWNTPEAQTNATLSNLAEGEYTVIVTDANGCSATSSVEITTPDEIAVSIADTACNSYEWNGTTYTETGEYTQTLHTAEGCDSVVTLRLTINHSSTGEFADLMCAGVPYTYENETFNEAGTYTVTLINSVGCDSVVTLTLTYADNCNGIVSGVITDDYTGDLIPNARVTIGNNVTYTDAEGQYSLEVLRGRKTLRVSAVEYISHSETIDVQGDTTINIALNSPRIITSDNISLTTYPYLEQTDTITITNTGNGTLVWSSITEYEGLALVEDSTIQRRSTRSLWDSIQTFATRDNAEQAVATDGFFIYTSSWMRPGEFNRYTPSGEYVETFFIENVGMIRNLSYFAWQHRNRHS